MNPKLPTRRRTRRIWPLALLGFAALTGGVEAFARTHGHVPSITDDAALWAHERAKLGGTERPTLTLVGASRSAYGLDLDVLDRRFPGHDVVQLSVRSGGLRPIVAELAADPPPPGLLVVSFAAPTFEDYAESISDTMLSSWRAGWRPALGWERELVAGFQSRLAFLRQDLKPGELFAGLREGRGWPRPDGRRTDLRRSVYAPRAWLHGTIFDEGSGHIDGAKLRARRGARHPGHELWSARLAELFSDLERLAAAGTQVVVVRLPSWGPVRTIEEELYPRARYWRQVEERCAALGAVSVHFEDHPELRTVVPADGSHIAGEDRADFTEALAERLVLVLSQASRPPSPL